MQESEDSEGNKQYFTAILNANGTQSHLLKLSN